MKIIYTRHAKRKFKILAKVGVKLTRINVVTTICNPENLDRKSDYPKKIASRTLDEKHILRVVFKTEGDKITIITFYPAKKGRYYNEKKN